MAKFLGSVIGIDIGRHSSKAVLLTRKGATRFAVGGFAISANNSAVDSAAGISEQIQSLLGSLGGTSKNFAICTSHPDALIRIIEQPETPPGILRDAVRLNGMALLNQDVKSFVLDCDKIGPGRASDSLSSNRMRYLIGATPREHINHVHEAIQKIGGSIALIQMGPIAAFNAFEFADEETFNSDAFMLVDIGHTTSTVTIGVKRELLMVRSIEYGGQTLLDALVSLGGGNRNDALSALDKGDEMMMEAARLSLTALTREISNSIGFVEGYCDQSVAKILIAGGVARSRRLLELLREDLHIPCETWNPFEHCEISLPADRKPQLHEEMVNLNIACGAAIEALRGK